MALTPKQAAFVREILVDLNGTQSAIRAGYSPKTAASIASELLQKPEIAAAVEEAKAERAKRLDLTADSVLARLVEIANVDPADLVDDEGVLKALHEIPVGTRRALTIEFGPDGRRVRLDDKAKSKALELLAKHLGLVKDKIEHDIGPTWAEIVEASMKPKGGS